MAEIGLLCLLLVLQGQKSFGQRVYANMEQNSGSGLLYSVSDSTASIDSTNLTNSTKLSSALNLLGLFGVSWQNLQFGGISKPKPSLNTPVYFKLTTNSGSLLSLLTSYKVELTNNGTSVATAGTGGQFLDLLGLFSTNESIFLAIPPSANTNIFNGIKFSITGVALAASTANIYYSFFITSPKISGDLDTVCENAMSDSLTLTLGNLSDPNITYYLFTDTLGLNYKPGNPLNTSAAAGYLGTFSNHQKTIYNPFIGMLAATPSTPPVSSHDFSQDYYVIAVDLSESPKFFYSGWKKITFKRTTLEAPGLPKATLQ